MYKPRLIYSRTSVPVLRGMQISKDAENVLLDFYHGEIPDGEIDAEGLVEFCFGLHLMYAHLSQDGHIYGRMVFQDTDKMPVYIPERDEADYFHMMEEPKKGRRIQDILEEEFIRQNPQIEKLGLKRN